MKTENFYQGSLLNFGIDVQICCLLSKDVVNGKQNGGHQTGSELKTAGSICVEILSVAEVSGATHSL